MKQRVCIVGATGYTGGELRAILERHDGVEIAGLFSSTGGPGARLPGLRPGPVRYAGPDVRPLAFETLLATEPDWVFLATPEQVSADLAPRLLRAGTKVIDLSGAFRLTEPADYPRWYGFDHPAPDLLTEACYGLTEWCRPRLPGAHLIANPGCYPTAVLLALEPLVDALKPGMPIVCDAMSGVSGAGRRSDPSYSFAELSGNVKAYSVGRHRHEPEIRAALGLPETTPFAFVTHLLPIVRGIHATIHVVFDQPMTEGDVRALFASAYDDAALVEILEAGVLPDVARVAGTPHASIGFVLRDDGRHAVLVCVIDNLLKGAASQAVQNLNLAVGLDEREGLSW